MHLFKDHISLPANVSVSSLAVHSFIDNYD